MNSKPTPRGRTNKKLTLAKNVRKAQLSPRHLHARHWLDLMRQDWKRRYRSTAAIGDRQQDRKRAASGPRARAGSDSAHCSASVETAMVAVRWLTVECCRGFLPIGKMPNPRMMAARNDGGARAHDDYFFARASLGVGEANVL
jgi:hypothetical protein